MIPAWLIVVVIASCLWVSEVITAYQDDFLTPNQMKSKGFTQGLPLIAHSGIFWGDLVLITPLLGIAVKFYSHEWELRYILIDLIISVVVGIVLMKAWEKGASHFPESSTYKHHTALSGVLHGIYMMMAFTIILLLYFDSSLSKGWAAVAGTLLGTHVFLSTHIVLGWIGPDWFKRRPDKELGTWLQIGGAWAILFIGWLVAK